MRPTYRGSLPPTMLTATILSYLGAKDEVAALFQQLSHTSRAFLVHQDDVLNICLAINTFALSSSEIAKLSADTRHFFHLVGQKRQQGKLQYGCKTTDLGEYRGELDENNEPYGEGVLQAGEIAYRGTFLNGKFHGFGYSNSKKEFVAGERNHGELCGSVTVYQ